MTRKRPKRGGVNRDVEARGRGGVCLPFAEIKGERGGKIICGLRAGGLIGGKNIFQG